MAPTYRGGQNSRLGAYSVLRTPETHNAWKAKLDHDSDLVHRIEEQVREVLKSVSEDHAPPEFPTISFDDGIDSDDVGRYDGPNGLEPGVSP